MANEQMTIGQMTYVEKTLGILSHVNQMLPGSTHLGIKLQHLLFIKKVKFKQSAIAYPRIGE
jgi:hypothetical protein